MKFLFFKANDSYVLISQKQLPDKAVIERYPSHTVLPADLIKAMTAIEQKKCLPQSNQLQSFRVVVFVYYEVDCSSLLSDIYGTRRKLCRTECY